MVACGSVVVMMIPSMLCILGVFSGVRKRTFLVEMMWIISFRVMYLTRSGGNGWLIGMLFPACMEGKEDEEAKVTEGVTVFVFFLTEEGTGSDSFD